MSRGNTSTTNEEDRTELPLEEDIDQIVDKLLGHLELSARIALKAALLYYKKCLADLEFRLEDRIRQYVDEQVRQAVDLTMRVWLAILKGIQEEEYERKKDYSSWYIG